jgi:hypothetical protein
VDGARPLVDREGRTDLELDDKHMGKRSLPMPPPLEARL